MKNIVLGKFIFIVGIVLLFGGCSGMVMFFYVIYGILVGIIVLVGGYSEWYMDSCNYIIGDSYS